MRVALVYDRLNKLGGAERVLQAFHELYPQADWYTSVHDKQRTSFTRGWTVYASWLNQVPFFRTHHEWIPYLMPFVFESFNFSDYDLVISVGSAESKGVITRPTTHHLHYCLTPTRYLYSHSDQYLNNPIYRFVAKYLRMWDRVAATRPDSMIAISTQVKNRIQKYYKRDSEVIFPPVDTQRFRSTSSQLRRFTEYFLVVSRLVPYKKIDILVRAANETKKNLVIVGTGSENARLKSLAGPTVHLVGAVPDAELPSYYQGCLAYLQANEEDFGITMCEALAAGKPVIAYKSGGAMDIVIPGKTGLLLEGASVDSFARALTQFDTMTFAPSACITSAKRFDKAKWITKMKERIDQLCQVSQK